jgi:cytochrome c oxidase accessory protein FixG
MSDDSAAKSGNILTDLGIDESFRDTLSTVDEHGKRIWLYPKKPGGKLFNARQAVGYLLFAFMVVVPFIKVNGHPLFLLNVMERKFIVFGTVFWPQDFHLVAMGLITFIIFIIMFTVIFGRVWCGWTCPQTIFMELIYRRIEYWVEGDAVKQKRLQESPWSAEKIRKRGIKHALFLFVSFVIAHIVQAWIVGIEQVYANFTTPPRENLAGFLTMLITTLIIYGIYARFREQMCTTFCPYGRLQGVLLGNDTMVVGYDYKRGEPRGKAKDKEKANLGDCVDCGLCVRVCPTGIDIRHGTQLECVNCTACIDACDDIMEKLDRPKRLIGFHSINGIESGLIFKFSARQKAYSLLMVGLLGLMITLGFMRSSLEATVLRSPGTLYYKNDDGTISNLYQMQIINKTFEAIVYDIKTDFEGARIQFIGNLEEKVIESDAEQEMMFFIFIPKEKVTQLSTKIRIIVESEDGKILDKSKTTFLGPLQAGGS